MKGRVEIEGSTVQLHQETNYPWDGQVKVTLTPEQPVNFTLALRVPGWAQGRPVPGELYRYLDDATNRVLIRVNGAETSYELKQGFAHLKRDWSAGDVVEVTLPMPVRRVVSSDKVAENQGKVAVERGPLVYCAEGVDNDGHALDLTLSDNDRLEPAFVPDLLGGVTLVKGEALTLLPYYAWSHRGVGEMAVWLRRGLS